MTRTEEKRYAEMVLMYKSEGKIPLGGTLLGGKDNIKLYALDGGCKVVNWTHLAQHSIVFGLKASAFINCEKLLEQLIN
jgi:hypothetical protein